MSIMSYLTIVGSKIGVVLPQVLDFLDEVVLVCFGMWFVDAFQSACNTSTANVRSRPVTL